jgi:UDP-glucose 4-epimerase
MRALVTGGAGFIGSHLVDALVRAADDVTAVDDLSRGTRGNLTWALGAGAGLEVVDVTDSSSLAERFATLRPEVVYHLAAQVDVARAVADPLHDAAINVLGTVTTLEAACRCGAQRFVLASTGGIYGDAATIPTSEDAPVAPLSPYGASKAAAEHYVALYARLHGMSTVCLRMANVYGPRQLASGEGGVIARFCRARTLGEAAPVFGDGLQTRDFVYVTDVAAAFLAAGRGRVTGSLNVGSGRETTVLDLVHALALQPDLRPRRLGEVRRSCLDAAAAARCLPWRPRTALAVGLAETLRSIEASL